MSTLSLTLPHALPHTLSGSWAGGCGGGNPVPGYETLKSLGGVASGYEYKFEGRDARCKVENYTKYVKVLSYVSVGKGDEEAMKRYIGSTGPLSVCVDASDWGGYSGGIKTTCGTSTDHCVQLVGYGSHEGTDYWTVRNRCVVGDIAADCTAGAPAVRGW
jgi:hypothetical protein